MNAEASTVFDLGTLASLFNLVEVLVFSIITVGMGLYGSLHVLKVRQALGAPSEYQPGGGGDRLEVELALLDSHMMGLRLQHSHGLWLSSALGTNLPYDGLALTVGHVLVAFIEMGSSDDTQKLFSTIGMALGSTLLGLVAALVVVFIHALHENELENLLDKVHAKGLKSISTLARQP
jgi:biopolymer transport protein ExbB/TolQ